MTRDEVIRSVAQALLIDSDSLHAESAARDVEEWDSMGTMAIMSLLDGQYGIRLSPGDASLLQSMPGILLLLEKAGKL